MNCHNGFQETKPGNKNRSTPIPVYENRYWCCMDKVERRFVINYFWMKGWGAKVVHQELTSALGSDADGPS
jgi:ribonuclease HI